MVVVGNHFFFIFAYCGLVVEIPTELPTFEFLLPFQRQPRFAQTYFAQLVLKGTPCLLSGTVSKRKRGRPKENRPL